MKKSCNVQELNHLIVRNVKRAFELHSFSIDNPTNANAFSESHEASCTHSKYNTNTHFNISQVSLEREREREDAIATKISDHIETLKNINKHPQRNTPYTSTMYLYAIVE